MPATVDVSSTTAVPVPDATSRPDVDTAIADMHAAIENQVDRGDLDTDAGADLHNKVDQVAREVSEGGLASARYYAGRVRDKLGKYRDDALLTPDGYQILIAHLDVLDHALG